MGTARISQQATIAGVTFASAATREDEVEQAFAATMAAGIAGELTTRTSNTAGVFTVASGHGVTTSNKITVFWTGGACYNCTVSATTGTTITISAATGDNLPSAATAVVIGVETTHAFAFDGDLLTALAVACANRSMIRFVDSGTAVLIYAPAASEGRLWVKDQDITNPVAGDSIGQLIIANGETTAANMAVGVLQSSS